MDPRQYGQPHHPENLPSITYHSHVIQNVGTINNYYASPQQTSHGGLHYSALVTPAVHCPYGQAHFPTAAPWIHPNDQRQYETPQYPQNPYTIPPPHLDRSAHRGHSYFSNAQYGGFDDPRQQAFMNGNQAQQPPNIRMGFRDNPNPYTTNVRAQRTTNFQPEAVSFVPGTKTHKDGPTGRIVERPEEPKERKPNCDKVKESTQGTTPSPSLPNKPIKVVPYKRGLHDSPTKKSPDAKRQACTESSGSTLGQCFQKLENTSKHHAPGSSSTGLASGESFSVNRNQAKAVCKDLATSATRRERIQQNLLSEEETPQLFTRRSFASTGCQSAKAFLVGEMCISCYQPAECGADEGQGGDHRDGRSGHVDDEEWGGGEFADLGEVGEGGTRGGG